MCARAFASEFHAAGNGCHRPVLLVPALSGGRPRKGTGHVLPGGSGVSFEASRAGFPPSPTLCCWDWPLLVPVNADRAVSLTGYEVYGTRCGAANHRRSHTGDAAETFTPRPKRASTARREMPRGSGVRLHARARRVRPRPRASVPARAGIARGGDDGGARPHRRRRTAADPLRGRDRRGPAARPHQGVPRHRGARLGTRWALAPASRHRPGRHAGLPGHARRGRARVRSHEQPRSRP